MKKKMSLFEACVEMLGIQAQAGNISPSAYQDYMASLLENHPLGRIESADIPLGKFGITRCCCGKITSDENVCHKKVILQSKIN